MKKLSFRENFLILILILSLSIIFLKDPLKASGSYFNFEYAENEKFIYEIATKENFVVTIPAISNVLVCNNKIWTYDSLNNLLYKISIINGEIIQKFELKENQIISSLGCFKNKIILASFSENLTSKFDYFLNSNYSDNNKSKKKSNKKNIQLYNLVEKKSNLVEKFIKNKKNIKANLKKIKTKISFNEPIRDIFCNDKFCFYISDNIYYSDQNFSKWHKIEVSSSKEIPKKQWDPEKNPFHGWQDKLTVSRGRYFRGLLTQNNTFFLLDPFLSYVVYYDDFDPSEIKKTSFFKWGGWGKWKGYLMFPKSFIEFSKFKMIAVSDTELKTISLFDYKGNFLSTIGRSKEKKHFIYPLDIASWDDNLFVADYGSNELISLKFMSVKKKEKEKIKSVTELLREDLFTDEPYVIKNIEKTRCLHCHDGLETYSLKEMNFLKNTHPVMIENKTKNMIENKKINNEKDLPLFNNKLISCHTCHDPHHLSLNKNTRVYNFWGEDKIISEVPYYLRTEPSILCQNCHNEKYNKRDNHFKLEALMSTKLKKKNVSIQSCSQCHSMHDSEKYLNRMPLPELCQSCHKETKMLSHPLQAKTNKQEEVLCISCHGMHGTIKDNRFARHSEKDIDYTCLECHDEMKENVGQNKHLSIKEDPKQRNKYNWPGVESVCMDCHNPHKRKLKVLTNCRRCHENRKNHDHIKPVPVTETERAKNIKLINNKIVCLTCHEQHGNKEKFYLKDKKGLIKFCSSCHGKDTVTFFDKYHEKFDEKNKNKK